MSINRLSEQQKKKRRKRIIITVVIVVLVLVIAAVLLVRLRESIAEKYAKEETVEVLAATVSTGSIRTTVSGSGSLSNEESVDVVLPANVVIDQIAVSSRDSVEEGELLATINTESVITAMAEIQAKLDELDVELSEAETEEVDSEILAPVAGRVKKVYASVGEDVAATMYENGALVLLSLDGYMTLDIDLTEEEEEAEEESGRGSREMSETEEAVAEETEESPEFPDLSVGDKVSITDSYDDTFTGTVKLVTDDLIRIYVADNLAAYGDVGVVTVDGVEIGSGTFEIHEPLAVTGYAGTVTDIYVSRGDQVEAGETLLELSNTSYTAHYESLLKERAVLEEELQQLIQIYQEGGIYAPVSGLVDSLSYNTRNAKASSSDTTFMTIRPSENIIVTVYVDESDVLSLAVGQEATITVSSIDDGSFTATVTEIASEGTSSGGVTQYAVTMTMERTDEMKSGMTVTAAISISGAEDALILPADAVQQSRDTYYVYTSVDEESGSPSEMASVEIGVSGNGNMEIVSGLSEGDVVYYTKEETSQSSFGFSASGMSGSRSSRSSSSSSSSSSSRSNSNSTNSSSEMFGGR